MNTMIKSASALILLLFLCLHTFAQPNEGGLFEPVTDTPIDAGIALVAAAGIGYGLKQLRKRKQL